MTPEQKKAAAIKHAASWEGPEFADNLSAKELNEHYNSHQIGVEAGITIGLEAKIELPDGTHEEAYNSAVKYNPEIPVQRSSYKNINESNRLHHVEGYVSCVSKYAPILAAKDLAITEGLNMIDELEENNKILTDQIKAIQSKCVSYEGELERKEQEIRELNRVMSNFPNQ